MTQSLPPRSHSQGRGSQPQYYSHFGLIILCCGGCPMNGKTLSIITGLEPQCISSTSTHQILKHLPNCDN